MRVVGTDEKKREKLKPQNYSLVLDHFRIIGPIASGCLSNV